MENLIFPLLILGAGILVTTLFYVDSMMSGRTNRKPSRDTPETQTGEEATYKTTPKQKADTSFNVWQGVKFGFGLGIGLILATVIFWLLIGSFLIVSIKSILSAGL